MTAPFDDAERSVLGSMLRDPAVIGDVVQILRPDYFRVDAHRVIFAAISELYGEGRPVDLVTLADHLHKRGQIENIGGYATIGDLVDVSPTGANAEYHARLVRDRALLRELRRVGAEIEAEARDQVGKPEQLLDAAEQRILALAHIGVEGQSQQLAHFVDLARDAIDARLTKGSRTSGISTGFIDLDEMTAGLHPGELVIVAARPSVGKTALGLALARNACRVGVPVFFASLEQRGEELAERLMCSEAGVDGHRLRSGTIGDGEVGRLTSAGDRLSDLGLFIDDLANQRMIRITATARRRRVRDGIGLVVIDYLQLIEPDNRREPRHEQVAGISRRLKQLARELNVPVVALAQLNREVENRQGQEPRLSDLREFGAIEADADTVVLLNRPNNGNIVDLIIAKQRNGPTGKVSLMFRKEFQRFENLAIDPT